MTVEHHHKDEETLIARSYKGFLETIKTPPSRATWLTLVVALLVVALVGSWFYFTTSATAASSSLWLKKYETPATADDLQKFAKEDPGSIQARFAEAEAARRRMQEVALLGSITDRPAAAADVAKARDAYEKLVREAGETPALMQESLMGAAKANETLGDIGKAKQFFQQLARDYPNTALGDEAAARVKALDDESSKKVIETLSGEFAPSNK